MWWIGAFIVISQPGVAHPTERVYLSSLSNGWGEVVEDISLDNHHHRSDERLHGSFFDYLPPRTEQISFGLLLSTRDITHSARHDGGYFPLIFEDGSVPADVARSVSDKIRQLKNQRDYRGPEVLGLRRLDHYGEPALTIAVEHVRGVSLPKAIEDRSPQMNQAYFEFILETFERGRVPVDAYFHNFKYDPELNLIRPIDVDFFSYEELEGFDASPDPFAQLRIAQLETTIVELDRAATDTVPVVGPMCRSIVKALKERFPHAANYEAKVRQALRLP